MTTTLRINGMTCNNCVRHVDRALRAVSGVAAVEVSLAEHRATVTGDADAAQLVAAVEAAGYSATAN